MVWGYGLVAYRAWGLGPRALKYFVHGVYSDGLFRA